VDAIAGKAVVADAQSPVAGAAIHRERGASGHRLAARPAVAKAMDLKLP
jgi:hypothetical protein